MASRVGCHVLMLAVLSSETACPWLPVQDYFWSLVAPVSFAAAAQVGGLAKLFEPLMEKMAKSYQASVGTELRKYGLRYEDLLDPQLNMVQGPQLKRACQACMQTLQIHTLNLSAHRMSVKLLKGCPSKSRT